MTSQPSSTLSRGKRVAILLGVTIVAVLLDQGSKLYAIQHWKNAPPISFWENLFRIEYAENHGAFLSLFSNLPDEVRFWILTVINGAVLVGLATYLLAARSVTSMTFLPLMLVIAGGIGNLIDRIRFGYVVDFMNLGWGNLRTGIFNVADMAITAGFILMIIPVFFGDEPAGNDQEVNQGEEPVSPPSTDQHAVKPIGLPDASSHGQV